VVQGRPGLENIELYGTLFCPWSGPRRLAIGANGMSCSGREQYGWNRPVSVSGGLNFDNPTGQSMRRSSRLKDARVSPERFSPMRHRRVCLR
jgi:hypothetical protein